MAGHGSPKGVRQGGRKKGTPNKINSDLRAMVNAMLREQVPNISKWIALVAEDNPGRAVELVAKWAEYDMPRQAAVAANVTGDVHVTVRTL